MCSSKEIFNEIDNQLFECSLILISLLLNQYKAQTININDFKSHTKNKITYILNNIGIIKDNNQKRIIESLINECIIINNTL